MPKEIVFVLLVMFSYLIVEFLFSYLKARYKYEVVFLVSLILLFTAYLLTPVSKEFFIIPFSIIFLTIFYNLNDEYKKQKIEEEYVPKIESLKQKLNEYSKKKQDILSHWERLEKETKKIFDMFYLVDEINKNLSVEKIIKEIYYVIRKTYPESVMYIGLIKGYKKQISFIIEYPEHRDHINKIELTNIKKDIVIFGDFNIYIFDFSLNNEELKILIEYKPMENDSEFLEFIDFIFSKIKLSFKRAMLFKEVEELSRIDGLTSLYLRRYIIKKLQEETIRAYRYNTSYSLLMIDIDFFKKVNDTYGHLIGDKLLIKLAEIFKEKIGGKGLISRWGGEEFLILLPYTEKKEAHKVADEIRKKVEESKFYFNNISISITVSIGVGTFPEDGSDFNQIISVADGMLYEAKRSGRNKVISSV